MEDSPDYQLIRQLYPALRRTAAIAGPTNVDPDDLVQEALLKVLRRGPLTELDNPLAYLRRTIVNEAHNGRRWLSRRRKALRRLGVEESFVPSYPAEVGGILDLPPLQRTLLYLVEVEGLPYEEAASELGMTAAAARTMAFRARRRARIALEVSGG